MRISIASVLLLTSVWAAGQSAPKDTAAPPSPAATSAAAKSPNQVVIPSGTKVPLILKQAISTKNAREGDPVYAETNFPVVVNERIIIPAGTYVQGRIEHVQRAGRVKGRAEILMHFTTLIYPTGYTVILPGTLDNLPGADKSKMKDEEGTVQQEGQTGEKLGKAASTAAATGTAGALVGLAAGGRGAAYGGLSGAVLGGAFAMLSRGADVKLDPGTTIEMVIQREVPLDAGRILVAGK